MLKTKLAALLQIFHRRGCKHRLLNLEDPRRSIPKENTFLQVNISTLSVMNPTNMQKRLLKNSAGKTLNGGIQEDGKIYKTLRVLKSPGSRLKRESPIRIIQQHKIMYNWKPCLKNSKKKLNQGVYKKRKRRKKN